MFELLLNCARLALRLFFQHAVLHDDLIVYFHEHASAFVPKGCLAVAVARAGAGDHMRQAQLSAAETDIDELIFRQLELSHHRLPIRASKADPFLLCSNLDLRATQYCRHGERDKTHCPSGFHRLRDTIHAVKLIRQIFRSLRAAGETGSLSPWRLRRNCHFEAEPRNLSSYWAENPRSLAPFGNTDASQFRIATQ